MAVKGKEPKSKMNHAKIAEGIIAAVGELYKHHSGEIQENLDESESKKVRVGFGVDIDCSESEPMVTVSVRFSASVTDRRVFRLDDPNQITLFSSREEAAPEPPAGEGEGEE